MTLPLTVGAWTADPSHSSVFFKVRHLGLSNVRGHFKRFDATLTVGGPTLDDVVVEATVDLSSVDTNQHDRDAHLRSTDFFATDSGADMTFRSTRIEPNDDEYVMTGDLTIRGTTKSVVLDVQFNGQELFPADDAVHAGFEAIGEIDREDFGIDFNMPLGIDKVALGQRVTIEIEMQFVAPSAQPS